jgi:hypothetical protein
MLRGCATKARDLNMLMVTQLHTLAQALHAKSPVDASFPENNGSRNEQEEYVRLYSWAKIHEALMALCEGNFLSQTFKDRYKDVDKQRQRMQRNQEHGEAMRNAWQAYLPASAM